MKHVIVPLDGSFFSEKAIPVAASLADAFHGRVTLVGVTSTDDVGEWTEYLSAKRQILSGAADIRVLHTDISAASALVTAAEEDGDLVCMSTHGRSGMGEALLGSTAEDFLRSSRLPVVLIGPRCGHTVAVTGTILVCLDGSVQAEAVLPLAQDWAMALDSKLRLVQVVEPDVAAAARLGSRDLYEGGYLQQVVNRGDRRSRPQTGMSCTTATRRRRSWPTLRTRPPHSWP